MAAHKNDNPATYYLHFLLLAIATFVSAAESSLCTIPYPVPKQLAAGKDTLPLLASFRLSAGYFFGGEDIHFVKNENDGSGLFSVPRSFSLFPLHVDRTTDSTLLHVTATLTITGGRGKHLVTNGRRHRRFVGLHSVSFYLDGYYSSPLAELCMSGSGTYTTEDGSMEHLPDVVLKLRIPSPPSLSDPFVTGRINGSSFEAISLVAYAEGDGYRYGDHASCSPLQPPSTARGAIQALGTDYSCAHLKKQLVSSYKLQYGDGWLVSAISPLQEKHPSATTEKCCDMGIFVAILINCN